MRIALFHPTGHFVAWAMSEGLAHALERIGHELVSGDPCDLVIVSGPELIAAEKWESVNAPKRLWFHETAVRDDDDFSWCFRNIRSRHAGCFFPGVQDAETFDSQWLNWGVDTGIFKAERPWGDRKHPCAFVGQMYGKRQEFLNQIELHDFEVLPPARSDYPEVRARELAEIHNGIKIFVVLPTLSQMIVTKVYEALACGSVVVLPELKDEAARNMETFEPGSPFLRYYDPEQPTTLRSAIEFFRGNEDFTRLAGGLAAQEMRSKHTIEHRLAELLSPVEVCT